MKSLKHENYISFTNKEMGGEGKQEDIYDLIQKIEELKLQEQEVEAEIRIFSSAEDKVLAIEEMRENKIEELKNTVNEMKKRFSKLQLMTYECKKHSSERKDERTRLKENEETLKKELRDACAVLQSLKKDIKHLNEDTRTSDEDAAILEKNRSLLWHYKNLTGVKWDYTAPSSSYVGSVFNSVKNYCKHFSYPAAETSAECVWGDIKSSAHADWSDIST